MIYDVTIINLGNNATADAAAKRLTEHLNGSASHGWTLGQLVVQSFDRLVVVMAKEGEPEEHDKSNWSVIIADRPREP